MTDLDLRARRAGTSLGASPFERATRAFVPGLADIARADEARAAEAAASPATPIPIHDAVAVQYGAMLATAGHIAGG